MVWTWQYVKILAFNCKLINKKAFIYCSSRTYSPRSSRRENELATTYGTPGESNNIPNLHLLFSHFKSEDPFTWNGEDLFFSLFIPHRSILFRRIPFQSLTRPLFSNYESETWHDLKKDAGNYTRTASAFDNHRLTSNQLVRNTWGCFMKYWKVLESTIYDIYAIISYHYLYRSRKVDAEL